MDIKDIYTILLIAVGFTTECIGHDFIEDGEIRIGWTMMIVGVVMAIIALGLSGVK